MHGHTGVRVPCAEARARRLCLRSARKMNVPLLPAWCYSLTCLDPGNSLSEALQPFAFWLSIHVTRRCCSNSVHRLQKEPDMPQQSAKRSEKGLLTPDNCVVTLIDLQP